MPVHGLLIVGCVFCVATGRKANLKKHVLLVDEVDGRQAMKTVEECK